MAKLKGSALLATLCFAAILSLSLSSFLALCYRSLVLSNRTLQATHCMELAEVGMEEALWTLNNGGFDGSWTYTSPSGIPTATKTIAPAITYENGATGQVQVIISNYNKLISDFTTSVTPQMSITARGIITFADNDTNSRVLQSDVRPAQLFTNAAGATSSLQITGTSFIDSFNSSVTPYNPGVPLFGAVVAGGTVDLGTHAKIYGYATTQGTTLQPFAAGAIVTGIATGSGIDPARVSLNGNQPLFDVVAPPSVIPSYDPVTGFAQLTNSVTLGDGAYQYDSIDLPNGAVVEITGNVVLKISKSVRTSGSGQIWVRNTGRLELQIDETDGQGLVLQGAGLINESGLAENVSVVFGGMPSGTPTSSIDVTNDFHGSIYLPNDTLVISNTSTIFGALIAKDIVFDAAGPTLHYDAALQKIGVAGVATPFALYQLREL